MTTWIHSDAIDGGPAVIRTASTAIHLLSAYANGDSYATVLAASIGNVAVTSADMTLSNGAPTGSRKLVTAGKNLTPSGAMASGATAFAAWVDAATSRVLRVSSATINQALSAGTAYPVTFTDYVLNQPT